MEVCETFPLTATDSSARDKRRGSGGILLEPKKSRAPFCPPFGLLKYFQKELEGRRGEKTVGLMCSSLKGSSPGGKMVRNRYWNEKNLLARGACCCCCLLFCW